MKADASKKSILDWLQFDLTNFFLQEYKEVNSEEIQGLYCTDYEKKLAVNEFNIFDMIRLRVFSREKNIESCEHINVSFFIRDSVWNITKLDNLLNILHETYGTDDNGKGKLNSEDITELKLDIFNRVWTLGSDESVYSIQITNKEKENLELHIIFLKKLLHCLDLL